MSFHWMESKYNNELLQVDLSLQEFCILTVNVSSI